eukprot:6208433-Pleurochrysis_carterae.AAC.2
MRRTSDRPGGTAPRSISSQLPLSVWLAISARSAAVQPARSSRRACLRVFGSDCENEARRTQPVLQVEPIGRAALRTERSAEGFRVLWTSGIVAIGMSVLECGGIGSLMRSVVVVHRVQVCSGGRGQRALSSDVIGTHACRERLYGVERTSPSHGFRNHQVQVWRISSVRRAMPSVLIAGAADEGGVGSVCATERREAGQGGLQSGSA